MPFLNWFGCRCLRMRPHQIATRERSGSGRHGSFLPTSFVFQSPVPTDRGSRFALPPPRDRGAPVGRHAVLPLPFRTACLGWRSVGSRSQRIVTAAPGPHRPPPVYFFVVSCPFSVVRFRRTTHNAQRRTSKPSVLRLTSPESPSRPCRRRCRWKSIRVLSLFERVASPASRRCVYQSPRRDGRLRGCCLSR